jgi:hypothetical protein
MEQYVLVGERQYHFIKEAPTKIKKIGKRENGNFGDL